MPPPSQEEEQVPGATTLDEGPAISLSREDAAKHPVIIISGTLFMKRYLTYWRRGWQGFVMMLCAQIGFMAVFIPFVFLFLDRPVAYWLSAVSLFLVAGLPWTGWLFQQFSERASISTEQAVQPEAEDTRATTGTSSRPRGSHLWLLATFLLALAYHFVEVLNVVGDGLVDPVPFPHIVILGRTLISFSVTWIPAFLLLNWSPLRRFVHTAGLVGMWILLEFRIGLDLLS